MGKLSLELLEKQAASILNAGPESGAYAAADGSDKRRKADAIRRAILEADAEYCKAHIKARDGHASEFMQWSENLSNGQELPPYLALGAIEIAKTEDDYDDDIWTTAEPGSRTEIEGWRKSLLRSTPELNAGYYWPAGLPMLLFSGFKLRAKIGLFQIDPRKCQAPDTDEAGVLGLAVGLCEVEGDSSINFSAYRQIGERGLQEIAAGMSLVERQAQAQATAG